MLAIDVKCDGRLGRVFAQRDQSIDELMRVARERFLDDEELGREDELRALLDTGIVRGFVHQGIDPGDVMHVYFVAQDGPVFACVVIGRDRLQQVVDAEGAVFENFSLQVAQGPHLSVDALHAAVEAWSARNFPTISLPVFIIEPWSDPDEPAFELLDPHVGRHLPTDGDETLLPSEVAPDASLAHGSDEQQVRDASVGVIVGVGLLVFLVGYVALAERFA